jgi:Na+/melibiose symporter-like transporter
MKNQIFDTPNAPTRPTTKILWIYALGQLGWSLASYSTGSLLTYFYMPPETDKVTFPTFLPQISFFLGLTLIGIIAFSGRLFDAFFDSFVGNWSDKLKSNFGKRRIFMAIGAIPMALFSFLMFLPADTGGGAFSQNIWWLVGTIFLYYVFYSIYVIPYTSLIAELGHHETDRLRISTLLSVTWAIGFLIGNTTPMLQGIFESKGMPPTQAFQQTVGIFACISAFFMLIPVFFLNEKKYARQKENEPENILTNLKTLLQHRNFRLFSLSYLLYWLSLSFIQTGIIYYVTVLFGLDKNFATLFGVVGFFTSFLFYPTMGYFQKRFGKKQTLLWGFLTFCVIFGLILLPLPATVRFWLVAILSAFPLAVFGIMPNAVIADIIYDHEQKTNKQQSGMFYAVSNFMMKVGVSLSNLLFPSLLLLGKSVENPLGVQLTIVAALVFCGMGFWVFRKYEETV